MTLVDQWVDTIYVSDSDRYIVSLVVGYQDADVESAHEAVAWALELTRDGDRDGTKWFVFDRKTGEGWFVRQGDIDREED